MKSFDEAIALTLDLARPLGAETVALDRAAGRVLAEAVTARTGSPRAVVSSMDGYAVASEPPVGTRLEVIGRSLPGIGFAGTVGPGQAVRIFTGAPLPAGAERVIIQENVTAEGNVATIAAPSSASRHVRAEGSDFRTGEVLLPAGRMLDPYAMVAAAGADRAEVVVWRRPRVVVLGTGDELVEPGLAGETAFSIPESVSYGVAALAERWGAVCLGRRRLPDDLDRLRAGAAQALAEADVVVVTGGASVGERDFARAAFGDGLELVFSKVAIKPGKPVWVGRAEGRLVVGLPGNPTSAMVTGRLFLAPLLAGLGGLDPMSALAWRSVDLACPLVATGDRETFHRAWISDGRATPLADQDSGAQRALAEADVLVRRLAHAEALEAGRTVTVLDL